MEGILFLGVHNFKVSGELDPLEGMLTMKYMIKYVITLIGAGSPYVGFRSIKTLYP